MGRGMRRVAYRLSCVLSVGSDNPSTAMTSGLCFVSTRQTRDNDKKFVSQTVVAGTSIDIGHPVGVTLPDETICNETSRSSSGELKSVDVAAITSAGSMSRTAGETACNHLSDDALTVALNNVVIEFIAQLLHLHCAVQHGKMGVPVPDDECNAWREKCATMLRTSVLQNHEGRSLTLEPSLEQLGIHPKVRVHAAASIVKLHEAAMHAGTTYL
ncbi:Hypothetical protein, putative [Bodo saltans]|uniref:Uncharacterized protein n=1 Tax=Bodo saltans TaxID=75058 RepID=A0A0S4IQQ0_BODSA|nr:Hypothetical protein, putative [Bodo saltans]|eukprot:CUF97525.1 Hypothetical protein, putative [Bodo saltans]